eukprot:CAMPEP_0113547226 /NCGR_PEP_ID=MMETSP0015_2-20120614/12239_1 /TAXON_ID=2838 /ORGANISM="Odontella" /LENGTH=285 /DNA_ID=CAMNT_0000447759 /DNA_START=511 /DNA_END=1365 /DNA_ORIENTATION=+ /assembly_acc=CAM_ASM_000160
MAPVTATAMGVARQTIDDPTLVSLLERLRAFAPDPAPDPALAAAERDAAAKRAEARNGETGGEKKEDGGGEKENGEEREEESELLSDPEPRSVDVEGLAAELDRWKTWRFQEQADLHEWIKPLNAIDAALSQLMKEYPSLLLIGPPAPAETESEKTKKSAGGRKLKKKVQAESPADVLSVPPAVVARLRTILRFLSDLLRNSAQKSVFNSVRELSALLAAADDGVSSLALECLSSLATPPALHRQQAPETVQHSTALHNAGGNRFEDGGGAVARRNGRGAGAAEG